MAGHGLGEATFILLGLQQPPLLSARPFLLLSTLLPTHRGSLRQDPSIPLPISSHLDQLDVRFEPILAGLQGAQQRRGSGAGGQGL